MNARLRVLYLTHHGPWPTTSGGRVRDAALIPEITRLAEVEVWAVSRTPADDRLGAMDAPWPGKVRIFADEAPPRSFPTRDSAAAKGALRARLDGSDSFDVIHVEGHYLVHLLPEDVHHRTVVVEHNVESHLLRQRAALRGLTPGLAADIETVASTEEQVWKRVGLVVTLSPEDQQRILRRVPEASVYVSTDGADHAAVAGQTFVDLGPADRPAFGFLANYAYPPNADALDWLVSEIFPELRQQLPDCRLRLVGSNLDTAVGSRSLPDGIDAIGWVDDLTEFWNQIDVLLCPLRIGGGVKVKLIEALRSGTLTVSTSVGLEGLQTAARDAIMRSDHTQGFVDAAIRLTSDRMLRQRQQQLVARARDCLPAWSEVASTLHNYWLDVAQPVYEEVAHGP